MAISVSSCTVAFFSSFYLGESIGKVVTNSIRIWSRASSLNVIPIPTAGPEEGGGLGTKPPRNEIWIIIKKGGKEGEKNVPHLRMDEKYI